MIKLIKSSFYNEADTKRKLVDFIASAGILSMSTYCKQFEQAFAQKQQRKYATYVSSGSAANLALIQSLLNLGRLKKGDWVGVSALTWVTNITPLIQLGLIPVALDCELDTLNVSPAILEKKIDSLQALFITNVLGFSDDITAIKQMCEKRNVLLIEDNCESLGSRIDGTLLGNFGIASTLSFFVGHHMSTIEGGMICTDDEELNDMLIMVRAHGWDRNLSPQKQEVLRKKHNIDDFHARYTFYDLAYNLRPTEINGFIGTTQIGYWDEIVSRRESNFHLFSEAIDKNVRFEKLRSNHMDIVSNFAVPVICKDVETFNQYRNSFETAGVEIRPVIAGDMSTQPFYRKYVSNSEECANARFINDYGFYFPNHPELTKDDISLITNLLS